MESTMGRSILWKAKKGEPLRDVFVFDIHGHMGYFSEVHIHKGGTPEAMIEQMDYLGINSICVSAHASIGSDYVLGNRLVARALSDYPERFSIGYAVVNPNYPQEMMQELKICFDTLGMKAIKVHSEFHSYPIDGPNYEIVWEYAKQQHCPVLVHATDINAFETVLSKYPQVSFVLAHALSFDDTFRYLERVPLMAKNFDNVFLDISGSYPYLGVLETFLKRMDCDRILYGSDMPFLDASIQLGRVYYAKISDSQKERILGLNAAELFNLEPNTLSKGAVKRTT